MKAKIKNCLNQNSGVFVCYPCIPSYEYAIKHDRNNCYENITSNEIDEKIVRIQQVMRRHHYMKDFDMPTCSMKEMLKHDQEYADLMEWFVRKFRYFLDKKGYKPARGDGVGVCFGSDQRCFMMYTVGGLKCE